MTFGDPEQSVHDCVNDSHLQLVGQDEREQRRPRCRTHRGKIADVDGERPVPDRIGRHKPPIEMNAFNLGIGGQHVERAALGPNHRRIVARPDEDPGRRGEARGNAGNERVLADI
jgi:hypothetical protein